jgi:hypothetical protein
VLLTCALTQPLYALEVILYRAVWTDEDVDEEGQCSEERRPALVCCDREEEGVSACVCVCVCCDAAWTRCSRESSNVARDGSRRTRGDMPGVDEE